MEPFIGQIILFGGNFAPRGWAICEGQLLPISQNTALFSIIGTIYGGDGRTTFALPDLRGRAPIGMGHGSGLSDRRLGSRSGEETHTLNITEMPTHNHLTQNNINNDQHVQLSTEAGVRSVPQAGDVPAGASFGSGLSATPVNAYGPANSTVEGQAISSNSGLEILNNGGNLAHNNMQPFLTMNYIIALVGIFPSRN
ncbi:MAG: phage tail protein [Aquimarina sp.]|nr:phage tail protein [Aquimarina sp.]